ncbi:MAG: hypothetical protein AB1458_02390 [Bacteroidota bacterium]
MPPFRLLFCLACGSSSKQVLTRSLTPLPVILILITALLRNRRKEKRSVA